MESRVSSKSVLTRLVLSSPYFIALDANFHEKNKKATDLISSQSKYSYTWQEKLLPLILSRSNQGQTD